MSDLNKHYETYKATHGENAYTMEKVGDTSRVAYLKHYLTKLVKPGQTVLDIGCGDMYLAKILPQYSWAGIDIAPDMSNNRAIKHDLMLEPYPFPDASFDAVICSEVLEHVWDIRKVHNQAKRLLKPNGVYIISTPNFDHIDHKLGDYKNVLFDDSLSHYFEHIRQYNLDVHTKFLNKAGFSVVDVMGCDAHYTKFFAEGRAVLYHNLNRIAKSPVTMTQVDQLIGAMFPAHSHTIMLISGHTK